MRNRKKERKVSRAVVGAEAHHRAYKWLMIDAKARKKRLRYCIRGWAFSHRGWVSVCRVVITAWHAELQARFCETSREKNYVRRGYPNDFFEGEVSNVR